MIGARRLKQLIVKRVVLHTKDGHSLEGVCLGVYADAVSLAHVTYVRAEDGSRVVIEGDVVVPRDNVSWIQEIAPHDAGADRS